VVLRGFFLIKKAAKLGNFSAFKPFLNNLCLVQMSGADPLTSTRFFIGVALYR
jgi:hypothetical protein